MLYNVPVVVVQSNDADEMDTIDARSRPGRDDQAESCKQLERYMGDEASLTTTHTLIVHMVGHSLAVLHSCSCALACCDCQTFSRLQDIDTLAGNSKVIDDS